MSLVCEVQIESGCNSYVDNGVKFGGIAYECRYGVGQTTLNITVVYVCFYFLFKWMAFTSSKLQQIGIELNVWSWWSSRKDYV